MKKILLLLLCIIFITGCTAKYEVYFDKNNINETINIELDGNINDFKNIGDGEYIEEELLKNYIPVLNINNTYYSKNIDVKNSKSYVKLAGSYAYNELEHSSIINRCFNNIYVNNTDDYIDISLKDYICAYYGDLDLHVSSYYTIYNSNGEKSKDNTHTWNINTIMNEGIELRIIKKHEEEKKSSIKNVFSIIVIVMLIITGGTIYFIKRKNY